MISGLVFEGEGIGTHWWVRVNPDPSAVEAQRLGALIRATIDQFDAYYSRFKPDSLVSRLNATGEINNISAELIAMLAESERLRVVSDGQFNVGVGAQLEQLGYDAEYSFRAGERAAGLTGSVVTVHGSSARLAAGARIDLGGVGKGWLIDSIGRVLKEAGVESYLVNGGGDVLAKTAPGAAPWKLAIENPANAREGIGELLLGVGAVAASGPTKRAWTDPETGITHHHLLDPETGQSHRDGPLAVYTYGATATIADGASTVLFLAPARRVEPLAAQLGVEYLIVYPGGQAVRSAGYPGRLW